MCGEETLLILLVYGEKLLLGPEKQRSEEHNTKYVCCHRHRRLAER